MNHITKILLTVLFVFNKDIISTHLPEHASLEYDITKPLDSCIANMFNSVDSDTVWEILHEMKNYKLAEFAYKLDFKAERFQSKVFFRDITFFVINCMLPQIDWDFSENKLHISIEKLFFNVKGSLHLTKNESYHIHAKIYLLNATIDVVASKNNSNNLKLSLSQDSYNIQDGLLQNSFWTAHGDDENKTMPDDRKRTLDLVLLEALPLMLTELLNQYQIFDKIYKCYYQSKNHITSTYPDFLGNEQQFYYLIPRLSFFCFYFKMIVIKGLPNFQLIRAHTKVNAFTHTLLIENVEGRMDLDYGTEDEKPLTLNFKIDYLTISINNEKNCVNANARYYQVNGTNGPLTYRQSPTIMNRIESAIASSIMSSMKVERTCDAKILESQIEVTRTSDFKAIKELYKNWIPFNDHHT